MIENGLPASWAAGLRLSVSGCTPYSASQYEIIQIRKSKSKGATRKPLNLGSSPGMRPPLRYFVQVRIGRGASPSYTIPYKQGLFMPELSFFWWAANGKFPWLGTPSPKRSLVWLHCEGHNNIGISKSDGAMEGKTETTI